MFVRLLFFGFELRLFFLSDDEATRHDGVRRLRPDSLVIAGSHCRSMDHWICERSEFASVGTMITIHSGRAKFSINLILLFVRLILFIIRVFFGYDEAAWAPIAITLNGSLHLRARRT